MLGSYKLLHASVFEYVGLDYRLFFNYRWEVGILMRNPGYGCSLLRWRGCVRLLSIQVSGVEETGVGLIVIASSTRPWIDLVDFGLV